MSLFINNKKIKSIYYVDQNGVNREIVKKMYNGKIIYQKISEFTPLQYIEKKSNSNSGYIDLGYKFTGQESSISVIFGFGNLGIEGTLLGATDVNTGNVLKIEATDYPKAEVIVYLGNNKKVSIPSSEFLKPNKQLRITVNIEKSYDSSLEVFYREASFYVKNGENWSLVKTFRISDNSVQGITNGNLYAFATHQINTANPSADKAINYFKYGKIYTISINRKIQEGFDTNRLRTYVPKKQTSTNKIGFYEKETNTFYETKETGLSGN